MAFIPNRRGRFRGTRSSSTTSSSDWSRASRVDSPIGSSINAEKPLPNDHKFTPLIVEPHHHRHTLDHSYFPQGNDDMNANVLFPEIPAENNNYADRVYADPYRKNVYILDRNGHEMFFTDEENGLLSPSQPSCAGNFSS